MSWKGNRTNRDDCSLRHMDGIKMLETQFMMEEAYAFLTDLNTVLLGMLQSFITVT
jgi:hypothetical protein